MLVLIASELSKFEFQQPKYALGIPSSCYFLKMTFLNHAYRVSIDDDTVMMR